MKRVFIINGSGGVGKDTFVKFVSKYIKTMNCSSVDPIKKIAKAAGWDGKKTEKSRKFLSDLKFVTSEYNDLSFEYITKKIEEFNESDNEFIFVHIREPKEIQRAKEFFRARTILVTNKNVQEITSNAADKDVYDYKYNYFIENSGTLKQLEQKAVTFIKIILEEERNGQVF